MITHCAFQDGTADLLNLEGLTLATVEAARPHDITLWSNLESFDRDVDLRFPPIDWRKMAHKLDVVQAARGQDHHLRVLPLPQPQLDLAVRAQPLRPLPRAPRTAVVLSGSSATQVATPSAVPQWCAG